MGSQTCALQQALPVCCEFAPASVLLVCARQCATSVVQLKFQAERGASGRMMCPHSRGDLSNKTGIWLQPMIAG